jgi:hypothetical protein
MDFLQDTGFTMRTLLHWDRSAQRSKKPVKSASSHIGTSGAPERPKFHISHLSQKVTYSIINETGTFQGKMVLEAAINGKANAVVTYNTADFASAAKRFKISVLSPADLLKKVRA